MDLRTTSGGDGETPFRFEMAPKCLKSGHPDLRGLIRGASDLRLWRVPYRPYGRLAPEFQTHAPGFEVNGPLAVPIVLVPAKRDRRLRLQRCEDWAERFAREKAVSAKGVPLR